MKQESSKPKPLINFPDLIKNELILVAHGEDLITSELLLQAGAKDQLFIGKFPQVTATRQGPRVLQQWTKLANIRTNNCTVAILHGPAVLALAEKSKIATFKHVLVPCGLWGLSSVLGLLRYGKRGLLQKIGVTRIPTLHGDKEYMVFQVQMQRRDHRRQYGPTGASPLELMKQLSGLRYTCLRWSELMESGEHEGDIDILIDQPSLIEMQQRYNQQICTYPLDVYSDDGQGGYTYKSVPYYTEKLSAHILDSSTETAGGIRVAAPYWRFLGFCYHLTFHNKSERIAADTEWIRPQTFHKPHYYEELQRLARLAEVPMPETFTDIETLLTSAGVMPSLDLIGFYSRKNAFLKKRYFDQSQLKPGLITFFVRDFGQGQILIERLRNRLKDSFVILHEGAVTPENRAAIIQCVRGGNWADADAPHGRAEPIYWFVCWDTQPKKLSAKTKRKHPRLDNENIRIKDFLRQEFSHGDSKSQRIIHSSDNSLEAFDHLQALGLQSDPEILQLIH